SAYKNVSEPRRGLLGLPRDVEAVVSNHYWESEVAWDRAVANCTAARSAARPSAASDTRTTTSSGTIAPVKPWSASHSGSGQTAGSSSTRETAPHEIATVISAAELPERYWSGSAIP